MNIWQSKFGDDYTDRNGPDALLRSRWFDKILPTDINLVAELGANKAHNLQAIALVRDVTVYGREINKKAAKIARSKGLNVNEWNGLHSDLVLCSGVLMHINPIDLSKTFNEVSRSASKYILMIEHKTDSIQTINTRWYKNAMWTMNTGKEFLDRYPEWECIKKGWVNGKPGNGDFTAPLTETKTGFNIDDYFWLLERK